MTGRGPYLSGGDLRGYWDEPGILHISKGDTALDLTVGEARGLYLLLRQNIDRLRPTP